MRRRKPRPKARLFFIAFLLSVAALHSSCIDYNMVNSAEHEMVKKYRTGEFELIKKSELDQLKKDAEIGKSVGRYQLYSRGFRTWRLDTATGQSCLLLTIEADWKKPEIAMHGCYASAPGNTGEHTAANQDWTNPFRKAKK